MNLQDFACAVSGLIWGGELGWDHLGGLEKLFLAVKRHVRLGDNDAEEQPDALNGKKVDAVPAH